MYVANNELTVAIGLSQGFEQRLYVSLRTIPCEVAVIVSWYGPGKPQIDRPNTRLVHTKQHSQNYRRGYVLNLAVRHVATPYVLLADADFLYPSLLFGGNVIPQGCVSRFYVARLTPQASETVLAGRNWEDFYCDYQGVGERIFGQIFGSHNPCVYPAQVLHRLRGYDERMEGWGGEDDDLTERTSRMGILQRRIPLLIGDLFHSGSADYPDSYQRGNTSPHNLRVLEEAERPIAANVHGWGDGE